MRQNAQGFNRFLRAFDHSHCVQPTRRTWSRSDPTPETFIVMAALAMVCRVAAGCVIMACVSANAVEVEPPHSAAVKPVCLNAAETRDEVKSRHLIEPFAALKFAAAQRKAEALSAKLCHIGDDFVYEITLLNRDGRIVHVEMGAATGKVVVRPSHETHETHDVHDSHEPQVKN